MKTSTQATQIGIDWDCKTGSISVPVYQNATFRHPALGQSTGFDYSRSGNPTRQILEDGIAKLDSGSRGFAYSSGMAVITSIMFLFKQGDHLVVTEDIYGGTRRLFDKVLNEYGLTFTYVDTSDISKIESAVTSSTRAVFFETLTNPLLKFADVPAISELCRSKNLMLIADNTFLTPYLLKPLDLGADVTIYSATKYLSGHNDTVAGLAVIKDSELAEKVYFQQNATGAVLGPQDSFLVLRGIKTLKVRMDESQKSTMKIAERLKSRNDVINVYYPGLKSHPGYAINAAQSDGPGAVLSFELESVEKTVRLLEGVKISSFAVSLGGVESIISYPVKMSHASIPEEERSKLGITDRLVRLSVGLEDADDLFNDLIHCLS
jgi:cystathionine beta-lyase/cystathionine gamma-synthase